jgi:hypothetical protein
MWWLQVRTRSHCHSDRAGAFRLAVTCDDVNDLRSIRPADGNDYGETTAARAKYARAAGCVPRRGRAPVRANRTQRIAVARAGHNGMCRHSQGLLTMPPPRRGRTGSSRVVDLLENVDHLAGAPVVGREGLAVFVRADLLREEETAGVADDGVRRRLEDDGERLDPA